MLTAPPAYVPPTPSTPRQRVSRSNLRAQPAGSTSSSSSSGASSASSTWSSMPSTPTSPGYQQRVPSVLAPVDEQDMTQSPSIVSQVSSKASYKASYHRYERWASGKLEVDLSDDAMDADSPTEGVRPIYFTPPPSIKRRSPPDAAEPVTPSRRPIVIC